MTPIEIATAAYATAAAIDPSMPEPTRLRIQAWASLLDGQDFGVTEAVQAVQDYYRKPNRFPIKPGDIIAAVKTMPVTSSPERISAFIDRWSAHPYSTAIQTMTGMDWCPPYPPPAKAGIDVNDPDALRAFHQREFKKWVEKNRGELVSRALANGEQLELLP
ncbi:hypothetical protein OG563_26855 [Nocardia vinacea]|uniref:Replicative helicase inhibitor G39P N-terminal domain-containing protein n=1 Tax=Nocardia vinacea TaxID=96468 RepID=A0ABZ1YI12_9NOCA|nr:hypothetical protein [Nocardia vinacea]